MTRDQTPTWWWTLSEIEDTDGVDNSAEYRRIADRWERYGWVCWIVFAVMMATTMAMAVDPHSPVWPALGFFLFGWVVFICHHFCMRVVLTRIQRQLRQHGNGDE